MKFRRFLSGRPILVLGRINGWIGTSTFNFNIKFFWCEENLCIFTQYISTRMDLMNIFLIIPRSRQNPKPLGRYDAEIIGYIVA